MNISKNIKNGIDYCSEKISDLDKIVFTGNAKANITAANLKTNKKYDGVTVNAGTSVTALQLIIAGIAVVGVTAAVVAAASKMIEKKVIKKLKKKYILIPMEGNNFGCGCGDCYPEDECDCDFCCDDEDYCCDDEYEEASEVEETEE